ncbi:MAG: cytochrome C [Gammaproteobacteria bacterium]|nr:cytochrome C [Gammaproteobacteria bacterium]
MELSYKAAISNIVDPNFPTLPPIATNSLNSTSENDLASGVYKGNFWQPENVPFNQLFGFLAYEKLYPPGVLAAFPLRDPVDGGILGLPAPDLEKFYLTDPGTLEAHQSAMPGKAAPFSANDSQRFNAFVENLPFFVNFPFGYTVEQFRRFTAEGVPIMPTDDAGRANAYPLMRIQAHNSSGQLLAEVDTVLPVASEADCQGCHLEQEVCTDLGLGINCGDVANYYEGIKYSADFITQSNLAANNVPGDTNEQVALNAAKINILRLHDAKNGTALDAQRSIVCANCHYTPALDLAHLGPNDSNGKEQTRHQSMSRVMHSYHANLPTKVGYDVDGAFDQLFPLMPIADVRSAEQTEDILEQTCYGCHPGKRTKCLRGAMSDGGMVCQDCHGQGTQVGDDFTENFPQQAFNVTVDPSHPDFNAGVAGKRVPWASEPKCQSCHLGDVTQVRQLQVSGELQDLLLNVEDKRGNSDGLRLRMAYRVSDHKSNAGAPNSLPLLDFADSRFASDRPLYRLSGASEQDGHGGLFCEGCHGSTHAIWPNANPWANDNKTAMDLQGHTGTIIECSTCHEGDLGITLDGPHGMHPVGAVNFAKEHGGFAERNRNQCRACHGQNGEGSVLSRTAADRLLQTDDRGMLSIPKGTPVGCGDCHENEL